MASAPKSEEVGVVIQTRPLLKKDGDDPRAVNFIGVPAILSVQSTNEDEAPDLYDMFDAVHDGSPESLDEIYVNSIEPLISASFKGMNSTILAYGQTGAGKTHCTNILMKRMIDDVWERKKALDAQAPSQEPNDGEEPSAVCTIELICLELYANKWRDLSEKQNERSTINIHLQPLKEINRIAKESKLPKKSFHGPPRQRRTMPATLKRASKNSMKTSSKSKQNNVKPLFGDDGGNVVRLKKVVDGKEEDLRGEMVTERKMFDKIVKVADSRRTTAATQMNAHSSRSHLVISMKIEIQQPDGPSLVAKLQILDLAGSENAVKSGTADNTVKNGSNRRNMGKKRSNIQETGDINLSLHCLRSIVSDLARGRQVVNYRDNPLTMFLGDSLGGNSKALILGCIAPTLSNLEETKKTLYFCKVAKKVTNTVGVNMWGLKKLDTTLLQEMLTKAQQENKKLKARVAELEKICGISGEVQESSGKMTEDANSDVQNGVDDDEEKEDLKEQVAELKHKVDEAEASLAPPASLIEVTQLREERNVLQREITELDTLCLAWQQKAERQHAKIAEQRAEIERLLKKPRVLVRGRNAGVYTSDKPDPSVYSYFANDIDGFSPVKKQNEEEEARGRKRGREEEEEEDVDGLHERYAKNPRLQGMLSRIGEVEETFADELDEELFDTGAVRKGRHEQE